METTSSDRAQTRRAWLSKVPEVTVWFWIIKILCTTVGESFADWINFKLGVGLPATALIFTAVLAVVLGWQLRLTRYVPFVYWLAVVVFSVTGTLYTDILTDQLSVPLGLSTTVFAAGLAVVFGVWYARERTLSIHSIVTLPRELFYWLAVLVTFALGTAAGDWILQLTGWGPGTSVLLPAGLILTIVIGWRLGANAVLSFWLAYILTRPLGANLGDWFASAQADHGLGLGTAGTSVIFLVAILATVGYLTLTRADVLEKDQQTGGLAVATNPMRERVMLGYYTVVAAGTATLLILTSSAQDQSAATGEEEGGAPTATAAVSPGQVAATFPKANVANFRRIAGDLLTSVQSGNQTETTAKAKDLETAWDDDEPHLRPLDEAAWHSIDGRIDSVLKAVRASQPDPATETQSTTALLAALQ
jgi:uncharacterized membrane-anchored protein